MTLDSFPPGPRRVQYADGAFLAAATVMVVAVVPSHLALKGIAVTPAEFMELGLGLCIVCAHCTRTLGAAKGRNEVRSAMLLLLLAALLSYGYAAARYLPGDEVKVADHRMVSLAALLGASLLVCDGVRTRERLDIVLKAVVVGGSFIASAACLQFFVQLDIINLFASVPGTAYAPGYADPMSARASFTRAVGTTGTPIELGVVCAMVLPLAQHYGFRARECGERAWWWWVACALMAIALFIALSRAAILGLAAVALVLFLGWPAGRRKPVLKVGLGFLVVLKLAVPGLLGAVLNMFAYIGDDSSVQWRTHDYPLAMAETAKNLLLGRGWGTWYAPKHQVFDNLYLVTLVEGGVIGLLAFVGLLGTAIYAAFRTMRATTDPDLRGVGLSVGAALVVPAVGAATFDLLSFATATGLMFLLIGASGALLRISRTQQRLAPLPLRPQPAPQTGQVVSPGPG